MPRYYDTNYELLKEKLGRMVAQVKFMITSAITALGDNDASLAQDMVVADEAVDHLEVEIDELVIKLLALQQPMATDLRFLVTALKVNNDLERMGDQAVNIAELVLRMNEHKQDSGLVDFTQMEKAVSEMVDDCLEAFLDGNVQIALAVRTRDDQVDELNSNIIAFLGEHMRTHPEDADRCISLLLVSRNLERIADLSTNIAEDVVYYVDGQIIKHLH